MAYLNDSLSVTNTAGYRDLGTTAQRYDVPAQAVFDTANGVVDQVDNVLGSLDSAGAKALGEALSAISALSAFKPGDVKFEYDVPKFDQPSFEEALDFSSSSSAPTPVVAPPLAFTATITPQLPPDDSGATAPGAVTFPTVAAPSASLSAISAPTAPVTGDITLPTAPSISMPSAPDLSLPTEPALVALTVPTITLPDLPSFTTPKNLDAPPDLPSFAPGLELKSLVYGRKYAFAVRRFAERSEVEKATPLSLGRRLKNRGAQSAATTWTSRGHALESETAQQLVSYRRQVADLQDGGENRSDFILQHEISRGMLYDSKETLLNEYKADFDLNEIRIQRADYDNTMLFVDAYYKLFQAVVELYRAAVAAFAVEATLYRNAVETEVAKFERWKMAVEAEISKTKLNTQQAQIYAATVQARSSAVALYEAGVRALEAEVSTYRSRMEAFSVAAEAARTKLTEYKISVDAYTSNLAAYKAQFDAYEARTRSVAAENQIEAAKTKISVADMQAAGADGAKKEIGMQVAAEQLKLTTRQEAASYENQRLTNALESINAQIQADEGRKSLLAWAAGVQKKDAQYDAAAIHAQAGARYFNAASDAAYRAAEQAFRTTMAVTQSATIAQESAGRAAASVAQGAYSALHVSAALQGNARVSADENVSTRENISISDWLDYSEDYQQTVSA